MSTATLSASHYALSATDAVNSLASVLYTDSASNDHYITISNARLDDLTALQAQINLEIDSIEAGLTATGGVVNAGVTAAIGASTANPS